MVAKELNVFLLTVDALRADHCSWLGYNRDTTSRIHEFAEDAIQFRECISVSSHTPEAMPPILSGYRPARFAANGFRAIKEPLLAERLAGAGYATGGFHSNPYLSEAYGFDRGFETFDDDLLIGRNRFFAFAQRALEKYVFKRGEYYARADEINQRSLDWLDRLDGDRPFFLWNHYMDVHGPYHAPTRYWADESLSASEAEALYRRAVNTPAEITEREQKLLYDSYDDEIRWLDEQVRSFFYSLRARDLFEDSLVILTADHGDAFGEHGYYTHPRYLHESLIHVPLLVSLPGNSVEKVVTSPVSTLDIVPTIFKYVSITVDNLPGTPLVDGTIIPDREDTIVYASATGTNEDNGIRRFAARSARWKATLERVIDSGEIRNERLFDLQRDPDEQKEHNFTEEGAERVFEQLREFSASQLASVNEDAILGRLADQHTGINERLEALGYK